MIPITDNEGAVVVVASVVIPDHDEPAPVPESDRNQSVAIVIEKHQIAVFDAPIPKA
jgi:hypothetical protein